MDGPGVQLAQRLEREPALMKRGMGNLKIFICDHPCVPEQYVEINRAGPPSNALLAPQLYLDLPNDREQLRRHQPAFHFHHRVQVPRLGRTDRSTLVKGRTAQHTTSVDSAQPFDCRKERRLPVAKIRSQADVNELDHRSPRTSFMS